jgi:hypothetical protein
MAALWDVAPCTLVQVDRRFGGIYCPRHQGDCYFLSFDKMLIVALDVCGGMCDCHIPINRHAVRGLDVMATYILKNLAFYKIFSFLHSFSVVPPQRFARPPC